MPTPPATSPVPHQSDLAAALTRLAHSLELRADAQPAAPSYLEMAVLADEISQKLHELARAMIVASRDTERSSWADVGDAFGVTRQAAMRRWTVSD